MPIRRFLPLTVKRKGKEMLGWLVPVSAVNGETFVVYVHVQDHTTLAPIPILSIAKGKSKA